MRARTGWWGALLVGALLTAWPLTGWAQPTSAWLKRLDTNGDAAVDLEEARHARGRLFDRLDADGDGALSEGEITAARKPRRADAAATTAARPKSRLLARADADKDGKLSRDEYLALASETLARRDRNGDGRVTADELPPPRPRAPRQP